MRCFSGQYFLPWRWGTKYLWEEATRNLFTKG